MHKAEISDNIDNPEIFVPRGGLHDLLGRWDLDEGRVLDFRWDRNDVLRMVLNSPGRGILGDRTGRQENQGDA